MNNHCCIFIDSDAEQSGIVGDSGKQPADPFALRKMLIDDHPVEQAEAGGHFHHASSRKTALSARNDHVAAHRSGSGACTPYYCSSLKGGLEECVTDLRSAQDAGDLQLVAARQKNPRGFF